MIVSKKAKSAEFLSLLYPSGDAMYPYIEEEKSGDADVLKLRKENWEATSFVNKENSLIEVDNLKTDASRFFVKKTSGNVEYIFADDVTKIYLDEKKIFQSENPTTISIRFNSEGGLDVNYKDNGNIEFYEETNNVVYNGEERNDLYLDGVLGL